MYISKYFKESIKTVDDFPKKNVKFIDYSEIFSDSVNFQRLNNYIFDTLKKSKYTDSTIDFIVGVESRGFTFATIISQMFDIPLVLARKKGKLPCKVDSIKYKTEYSKDVIEMQIKDLHQDKNYLIVDDILATGGTLNAIEKLIKRHGGSSMAFVFIDINLKNCEYNKDKLLKIL